MDKDFVAATIQAIGRCATNIGEVRDTCLNGLVQLLSNRDGESAWLPSSSSSLQLRKSRRRNPGPPQRFPQPRFLSCGFIQGPSVLYSRREQRHPEFGGGG